MVLSRGRTRFIMAEPVLFPAPLYMTIVLLFNVRGVLLDELPALPPLLEENW